MKPEVLEGGDSIDREIIVELTQGVDCKSAAPPHVWNIMIALSIIFLCIIIAMSQFICIVYQSSVVMRREMGSL